MALIKAILGQMRPKLNFLAYKENILSQVNLTQHITLNTTS